MPSSKRILSLHSGRAMAIRLSDEAVVDELATALQDLDISAKRHGTDTLAVSVPRHHGPEALIELSFFVRAWQLTHQRVEIAFAPA